MSFSVGDLAQRIGCSIVGDAALNLTDVRSLSESGPSHLTFVGDRKQLGKVAATQAGAVIVSSKLADSLDAGRTWLVAADAQYAFIQAMLLFRPQPSRQVTGISSRANVAATATIGTDVNIAPGAFVGEHAVIGNGCDIGPNAVVSDRCQLGRDVTLHATAVLYREVAIGDRSIIHSGAVIGADGFGYRFIEGRYERIPHTGTVVIEEDVEIGACTTIDRAMVGETRIGAGTKLDNLIMIGHNCRLGKHNAFASQVGLAGSVTSGDYVRCAGQVGIADHLHLGTGSTLGAKAGVMNDIPDGSHQIGSPSQPVKEMFRTVLNVGKLPEIIQQLKTLTGQVAELQKEHSLGSSQSRPGAPRLRNFRTFMTEFRDILPLRPGQGRRIGLVAGWGRFPVHFAREARRQGYSVQCVAISGMASEELLEICDRVQWVPMAQLGRAIRFLKRRRVTEAVMAGKVDKQKLFDPLRWFRLLPDWRTLCMWFGHCRRDKKDDTLLLAVVREFEKDGIEFHSALDYCPELLVKHGFLTRRQPTAAQWKDIRFGWEMAKEMGRLDVGQTVVVHDTAVIAVEAIEGTDECIRRAGKLCRRGGLTVVKVAKPQQDLRFDVPTIGTQTLQTMRESGARVLAIEAGMTILLDEPEVIALADKLGISIVSLNADEVSLRIAA